ncbi:FtsX-like permease family protein [Planomonospora venezuelensis]|uniref:Putative ABC transport system permease protein n=1 Tax=Planomonospora venezuelensis TaxID=1999 RepID=A0A841D1F8_PLAVE|nr:ABC transporter permease [Planomonospora venezuelensis]MBB5962344.1 putative ABC transport system permease protein [Planomonospora venezuelensis]GIN00724.1 transporter [Planomonospora venezuelensis]
MSALALSSLRGRAGGFLASFLAMFLGATILMAFGSLFDTSGGPGVDAVSREMLNTLAAVVGGWGLILVTFAVTSTLTLSVRQRAGEMALLRNIGATPAQINRLIVTEALVLAVVAVVLAVAPAVLAGRVLVEWLAGSGQIGGSVHPHFGGFAVHLGVLVTVAAAVVSAALAARRVTRPSAAGAALDAATGGTAPGWRRAAAAGLFLFLGADLAVVTATVMRGKSDFEPMATAGPASIWFSAGLALLAPSLLRLVATRLVAPLERFGGAAGHLAGLNLTGRSDRLAPAVMPVILFTGIATGTLYMQSTDAAANALAGVTPTADHHAAQTTNMAVIGMILVFTAIMVVNTLAATMIHRRGEFGRQRLIGATPRQILCMVAGESAVLTATGVIFGTVASLVTVIPFSIARTGSAIPGGGPAPYLAVVAVAAAIGVATSLTAARRTLRTPAAEAAAA